MGEGGGEEREEREGREVEERGRGEIMGEGVWESGHGGKRERGDIERETRHAEIERGINV